MTLLVRRTCWAGAPALCGNVIPTMIHPPRIRCTICTTFHAPACRPKVGTTP